MKKSLSSFKPAFLRKPILRNLLLLIPLFCFALNGYAINDPPPQDPQAPCDASPFCSDSTYIFPNSTANESAPSGGNYGCLGSTPSPSWYYMQIGTAGPMQFTIAQYDANGNGIDVDFAMWGPYTDLATGCADIVGGTPPIQCSYSTASTETAGIGMPGGSNQIGNGASTPPPAQVGEVYIVLIINYGGASGTVDFHQTNLNNPSHGSADCSIICGLSIDGPTGNICAGDNFTLHADNTNAGGSLTFTYQWEGPGGVTSTGQDPTFSANQPGSNIYTLTAISSDNDTCVSNISVQVYPHDTTNLVQTICAGEEFTIDTQSFDVAGTYQVILQSSHGCDSVVNLNLSVLQTPDLFDTVVICPADLPYIFGNQQLNSSGDYTRIGHIPGSSCDSTIHLNFTVLPTPQSMTIDTFGCESLVYRGLTYFDNAVHRDTFRSVMGCDSFYLTANIKIYHRTNDEQFLNGCDSFVYNDTVYYSSQTITEHILNIHGCDSIVRQIHIRINRTSTRTIEAEICQGESYEFGNKNLTTTGDYSQTVPGPGGCDSTIELHLIVHPNPNIKIAIEGPQQGDFCLEDLLTLTATGAQQYHWTDIFGRDYRNGSSIQASLYKNQNTYYAEGSNEWGCTATGAIRIYAENCSDVFIPSAFSPNGDGLNDKWGPEIKGNPREYSMEIFDRYGRRIYISHRSDEKWDGTKGGKPFSVGTYFYRIKGSWLDGTSFDRKGSFTLVR